MPSFVNHEPISMGLFNDGHNTAQGLLQPWQRQLTNTEGVLMLVVSRMDKDWSSLTPKMRKPWNGKDVEPYFTFRLFCIPKVCFVLPTSPNQTMPMDIKI